MDGGGSLSSDAAQPLKASGPGSRPFLERKSSTAQGSLANILPVLEDGDNVSAALLGTEDDAQAAGLERTMSDTSFDVLDSDIEDGGMYNSMPSGRTSKVRTPGDIRTAVLEWMYEEKDADTCVDLVASNAGILEDLISVFVSVVLHGKSDVIRTKVWRFLVQSSTNSLHFAFLVICNLNASCHQAQGVEEDNESKQYKEKRTADLAAIEKVISTIKVDALTAVSAFKGDLSHLSEEPLAKSASGKVHMLEDSLEKALVELEDVHDNQVLTNLDLNVRGRTARHNIDLLVQKVRNSLLDSVTSVGSERLRELDGRIGFIKTLTDLDEWLMRSVAREERSKVLEEKLESLAVALPLGAYFPTAVGQAGTRHRVLRLVLSETIVFNTARKCPFLLVAEVEPSVIVPDLSSQAPKEPRSPRRVALDALEMVSTKDFWKNPMQKIQSFKDRGRAESGVTELNGGEDNGEHEELATHFQKKDNEKWEDMQERIRRESPYGDRPNWKLVSMFVKSGDDLRQQQLGVLFVSTFQKIFLEERVPVWLSPYKVIATGRMSGLLEPARNADSIARIKERGAYKGIDEYFLDKFGPKSSNSYKRAQKNFLLSLVGYSIVAYLIKLHDRHNGNILVDTDGHLLHIDFGFMLGFSHKLERSPFKLTPDMIEILGGPYSPMFQKFRRLMEKAYIAANKHHKEIILLAELMSVDESSSECFAGGRRWVIDEFRARFNPGLSARKLKVHINDVIDHSLGNYTTRCYDKYQRCVNGIW
mmetsp:Transcript_2249/g.4280  ORF Transcript_2249/g.4280 Transcript_2249/m.4280 type:complete len:761 (-) Transcript_2249:7687-9969(-)